MIYTHVLNKGGRGVKSPLDQVRQVPAGGLQPAYVPPHPALSPEFGGEGTLFRDALSPRSRGREIHFVA
jgi:hypothetical protein